MFCWLLPQSDQHDLYAWPSAHHDDLCQRITTYSPSCQCIVHSFLIITTMKSSSDWLFDANCGAARKTWPLHPKERFGFPCARALWLVLFGPAYNSSTCGIWESVVRYDFLFFFLLEKREPFSEDENSVGTLTLRSIAHKKRWDTLLAPYSYDYYVALDNTSLAEVRSIINSFLLLSSVQVGHSHRSIPAYSLHHRCNIMEVTASYIPTLISANFWEERQLSLPNEL